MPALSVPPTCYHFLESMDQSLLRKDLRGCDGASNREALVGEILRTLGVETLSGQPEDALFAELESAPAVLALDNAETPWDSDTVLGEELMAQLAAVSDLALVASIRGEQRPLGPAWREALHGGPLALPDAQEAFLTISGERFRNDPALDALLEAVDCLPLAVVLLAYQAEGGMSDLAPLGSAGRRRGPVCFSNLRQARGEGS
jgi:hypothetical protein